MIIIICADDWTWPDDLTAGMQTLPAGAPYNVPENLFRKITDTARADWQVRFAGTRT